MLILCKTIYEHGIVAPTYINIGLQCHNHYTLRLIQAEPESKC